MRPYVGVETAENVLAAIHQSDRAAEAREDTSELHHSKSAPPHHDRSRKPSELEHVIGGDRKFDAGNRIARMRPTAGRDEHVRGAHKISGGLKAHRTAVIERYPRFDVFHAGTVEISGVGGFKPRDLPVLVREQR